MLGVAAYVVIEAIGRLGTNPEVDTGAMLIVWLSRPPGEPGRTGPAARRSEGLAQRQGRLPGGPTRDTAGSIGVLAAAGLVAATGEGYWDTAVAFAIGAFVAVRAVMLGRQVLAVLGQHAPAGLDIDAVADSLASVPGVKDVHDLHAWTLTSGMNVATAHLVLHDNAQGQPALVAAQTILRNDYLIEHATLQVEEKRTANCDEVTW